jgi:hypothetical protein
MALVMKLYLIAQGVYAFMIKTNCYLLQIITATKSPLFAHWTVQRGLWYLLTEPFLFLQEIT